MSSFSPEVLGRVFTLAASASVKARPHDEIDMAMALVPYRVAAVNRHWRRAALAATQCWTFVALPATRRAAEAVALKAHLTRVLDLTRSLPLDVAVHVGPAGDKSQAKQTADDDIFKILAEQAQRIRTLMMRNDGEWALLDRFFVLLRCPTPQLQRLGMCCSRGDSVRQEEFNLGFPTTAFPTLLPEAPRLEEIIAVSCPLFCVQPNTVLPSLKSLSLLGRCVVRSELVVSFLANAPKLEHFALTHIVSSNGSQTGPASLPITTLDLDENAGEVMSGISLPSLRVLRMASDWDNVDITSSSLTTLCLLRGSFADYQLTHLRSMQHIEHVSLVGEPDMDPARIDALFRALCHKKRRLWPCLRVLELRGIDSANEEEDGLLRVIRRRSKNGQDSQDSDSDGSLEGDNEGDDGDEDMGGSPDGVQGHTQETAFLEKVIFDGMSVQQEIVEEIQNIMGDKCVYLEYEDFDYIDRIKNPWF